MSTTPCPCGRGRSLAACCGRYHAGEAAPDAETLMRSRYSAYVLGDEAYLLATWHSSTRPQGLALREGEQPRWLGLTVRRTLRTGPDAAEVEFVARYRVAGRGQRMHETSGFVREDGCWFYLAGTLHDGT